MDKIWRELHKRAMEVIHPREVSSLVEAGGVGSAVESVSGRIYVSVCVDTACSLK